MFQSREFVDASESISYGVTFLTCTVAPRRLLHSRRHSLDEPTDQKIYFTTITPVIPIQP